MWCGRVELAKGRPHETRVPLGLLDEGSGVPQEGFKR